MNEVWAGTVFQRFPEEGRLENSYVFWPVQIFD